MLMDEINESSDVQENQGEFESYQEIGSEGEISQDEAENYWGEQLEAAEIENPDIETVPFSTYEERLAHVPKENTDRGIWEGERGESGYRPADRETIEAMKERGVSEIPYQNAMVDFSGVAEATVEIDNMTERRLGRDGNFEQCDTKLSEVWNKENHEGRDDWTPRDVSDWRHENNYSWHERNDMRTCDLVPTKIHESCTHLGGVSECKKASQEKERIFDD